MSATDHTPYLVASLNANPVYDAASIIARRQRLLGRSSGEPTGPGDERREARRAAIAARLDQIRGEFWTAPLPRLKEKLNALSRSDFPDLDIAVARLRQVAICRPDFVKLAQHRRTNMTLFNAFKAVVVLPPSKAGSMRERANRALAKVPPRELRRTIATMKSAFPHLYQLEADWLKQVGRLKKYSGERRDVLGPVLVAGSVLIGLILLVLVIGLVVSSGSFRVGGVVAVVFAIRFLAALFTDD